MTSVHEPALLAFDIGAKSHAWASQIHGVRASGRVDNAPPALRAFLKTVCRQAGPLRILVEATGVYFLDVALIAHELGAEVAVVNPRVAHHFAEALGQRNKTDALDAQMLLECLQRMPFRPWIPPCKTWLELREYGRFLVQLTDLGTASRNRLHALSSKMVGAAFLRTELKRMIASIDRRIERVRAKAVALIRVDAYLNDRFEALTSTTGIALVAGVSLLSELVTLPPSLSGRACVCHAGLDPRVFQSGTSVHKAPGISRRGNKYLRRALFQPALCAGVHDPGAKAFKDRLIARGKKPLQANVAIMRKMLTAAWAIVKNPQPYDSARLYPATVNDKKCLTAD